MVDKSGWKTTEFWVTLVAQVVPVLVVVGVMTTEQGQAIIKTFGDFIGVAVVFVAAIWSVVEYNKGRVKVKTAALEAGKLPATKVK